MLDLKFLRENRDQVAAGIAKKKFTVDLDAFYRLDAERRSAVTEFERLRSEQKAANQEMAALAKGSAEFRAKIEEMKAISTRVKALQARQDEAEAEWHQAYLEIPNIPHDSVPVGETEEDNVVHRTWRTPEDVSPHAKPHFDIPWFDRAVDLERGVKVTGAGFPFFVGDLSRLVRALVQFFLDRAVENGFTEVSPPYLVNAASATATGQLPDKEGQMYFTGANDGLYLIPTAEVPVTNFFRDEIFDVKDLPVKRVAYSPCFRREAGSYGKDVRGLNRVHQFDKVELVLWTGPDESYDELERLLSHAESLVKALELPYRTLLMCTADIGFTHAKQYDIEVWSGGQKRWLEVSSCSNFTDFQARRANIRYRGEEGRPVHVHTLNGSGLALPRILAALLENHLQADGRVRVPEALRDYYRGDWVGVAG